MNKVILSSIIMLLAYCLNAQQNIPVHQHHKCFNDEALKQSGKLNDPDLANQYLIYEENLNQIIQDMEFQGKTNQRTDTLINNRKVIPVVFHIIHKGGQENISRAQVEDAIALLNIDYNKLNSDTGSGYTFAGFNNLRADCGLEFRLAKIDPAGNCTDGIVRHYDPQTNFGYFKTMSDYCWVPSRYLNVFVVNFIYPDNLSLPEGAFIGGMSPFPPSNALSQALTGGDTLSDGVLIRHDCIGSIGTATAMGGMPINAKNRTFTHETGHYFNLYHPFQTGPLCVLLGQNGCGSSILGCGDEVSDTPPVIAATQNTSINCYAPGSVNTCQSDNPDMPDMIENYMDYQWGYCTNLFTIGQLSRINATLQSDRRKLWSKENLISTGVLDTNESICPPIADFIAVSNMLCAGSSMQFYDMSFSGQAQSWFWKFDGGTPSVSTDQNPVITYNTPGVYQVFLKAINNYGTDSIVKQNYIIVKTLSGSMQAPFTESFETTNLNNGWYINNDAGNTWQITDSASYTGNLSLRIKNFSGNSNGSYDEIVTPAYDFTNLPTDALPMIRFRLAYAGKITAGTVVSPSDTAYDALRMYVSTDCGKTWSEKYYENGAVLGSTNPTQNQFIPASVSQWKQVAKPLPYSYLSNNHVMFKFVFYSNGGNNLYIDDININSSNAGIEDELFRQINFMIKPNPVTENSEILFNLPFPVDSKISVYDVLGKEVFIAVNQKLDEGQHIININRTNLGVSGFYLVKASFGNFTITKKVIVE